MDAFLVPLLSLPVQAMDSVVDASARRQSIDAAGAREKMKEAAAENAKFNAASVETMETAALKGKN